MGEERMAPAHPRTEPYGTEIARWGIAGRKLEEVYRAGESCAQPSYYPFDGAEHRGGESFRITLAFRVGPVCLPIRNRPLRTKSPRLL